VVQNTTSVGYKEIVSWSLGYVVRNYGYCSILEIAKVLSKILKRDLEVVRTTLHKLFRNLEKKGVVKLSKRSGLTWVEVANVKKAIELIDHKVDLISISRERETTSESYSIRQKIKWGGWLLGNRKVSIERCMSSKWLWSIGLRKESRDDLEQWFLEWVDRVRDKVLIFVDPDTGDITVSKYSSRFTDPRRALDQLSKFKRVYSYLTKRYSSGVFLTITLPPIFPIGIAPKVLSYMIKQLRSWISKRIKRKFNLVTVREFQDNGFIHAHIVIFGVERIEDKEVLTKRLDLWMVTAILRLEKWFDYGVVKRLIKRYLRYCKKHKKYEGPINWITPINFRTGEWNPPPDALKFAKSKNCDGGFPSVGDYLSKYITKMYRAAKMISEGEIEASLLGPKVVLYWLTGVRMFSFDNKLYKELGLSRKRYRSGLRFLGSFIWFELPDHIFWEIYDQLCELGFVKKLQT